MEMLTLDDRSAEQDRRIQLALSKVQERIGDGVVKRASDLK